MACIVTSSTKDTAEDVRKAETNLQHACDGLVEFAHARGGQDDGTVVALRYSPRQSAEYTGPGFPPRRKSSLSLLGSQAPGCTNEGG